MSLRSKELQEAINSDMDEPLDEAAKKVDLGKTMELAKGADSKFFQKMAHSAAAGATRFMTATSNQFKGQLGWRSDLGFGLKNKKNQTELQNKLTAAFEKVIAQHYR